MSDVFYISMFLMRYILKISTLFKLWKWVLLWSVNTIHYQFNVYNATNISQSQFATSNENGELLIFAVVIQYEEIMASNLYFMLSIVRLIKFTGSPSNVLKTLSKCRSIRNINTPPPPPPPGKPGLLSVFFARGVGNLIWKAMPGVGNLTLPGWDGNLNWKCEFQNIFFGQRLSNACGCFRTWSHLKEKKYIAFVSKWLT